MNSTKSRADIPISTLIGEKVLKSLQCAFKKQTDEISRVLFKALFLALMNIFTALKKNPATKKWERNFDSCYVE